MCIRYESEKYLERAKQDVRDNPPAGDVSLPISQRCEVTFEGENCPAVGTVWVDYIEGQVSDAKMGSIASKAKCFLGERRGTQA